MDNLFLEEFVENNVNPKDIKEIQIFNNQNTFVNPTDDIDSDLNDYNINTNNIIHKTNVSEDDVNKIYNISSLYTKEVRKENIIISYENMDALCGPWKFNEIIEKIEK